MPEAIGGAFSDIVANTKRIVHRVTQPRQSLLRGILPPDPSRHAEKRECEQLTSKSNIWRDTRAKVKLNSDAGPNPTWPWRRFYSCSSIFSPESGQRKGMLNPPTPTRPHSCLYPFLFAAQSEINKHQSRSSQSLHNTFWPKKRIIALFADSSGKNCDFHPNFVLILMVNCVKKSPEFEFNSVESFEKSVTLGSFPKFEKKGDSRIPLIDLLLQDLIRLNLGLT